jgi:23S rRNA pseudouridine1911/1915/1917 synthase
LIGDAIYGGAADTLARQALHAWRLGFQHPAGGGLREWRVSLPADLCDGLRHSGIDPDEAMEMAGVIA